MSLETDLSRKPYFDDYDQEKNFYRVLYRPGVAVQARELNQTQSILQDQIDKFGRHIFKDGSVVEGCSFTFDNDYDYVKIKDNYANNFAISNIQDLLDLKIINQNGLEALVINTIGGLEAQDPDLKTLYVKYLNTAQFPNGASQSVFSNGEILSAYIFSANVFVANVVVATVANSTGKGYAFTTTEGVIFKKGFFIRVPPQTIVVSKYSNLPDDISVGFDAIEQIITPEIDTTLNDNASGTSNFTAPGAHRLKLIPTLVTKQTSTSNTSSFFSLCDFQNGLPVTIKSDPQYASLGKEQARRTFETNGDYVVEPFGLSVGPRNSNTTHLNLVVSPGIGYVKGNRVEFLNNYNDVIRKGLDFESVSNQVVSTNFGYYFLCNEFVGDFNNDQIAQIELHNVTRSAITNRTFLGTTYSAATKIGTAYVRGVSYDSGTPGADAIYKVYLFNLRMDPGFSVSDIRSLIYFSGSLRAVADVILTFDAATSSNTARIQEATGELMVYPFGQKAIKPDGFTNQEFIYRNKSTANFTTTGNATITIITTVPGGTESIVPTGQYSTASKQKVLVVPSVNGFSSNLTGQVTVYSTNTLVLGTSTTFATEYVAGDYLIANTQTRRIVSVVNNTSMFVDAAFTSNSGPVNHQKVYPAGVPINLAPANRVVSANASTLTVSLGQSVNAAFSSTFYYDVNRDTNVPIQKNIVKSAFVRIDLANNAGGTTGPWCLGLPDVLRIRRVYVGPSGSYSNTNPDLAQFFKLDNGQRDAYYDLAYLSSTRLFSSNTSFLIELDHFTTDTSQGVGFFTARSYPIDDANTANTSAIQTFEIPTYTSKSTKTFIDLRDAVDFRPFAVNTAISTTNPASATINPVSTLTLFSYGAAGSYLPAPDSAYEVNLQYYLPRKDRISLSTDGEVIVTEGASELNPKLPPEPAGSMTIGTVDVTPYPSLDATTAKNNNRYDYACQLKQQQIRRYTMKDVGVLARRIDNLEYYTSLSLIEQAAQSLLVRSSVTGENRFKNGILVDPFKDHTIGNTLDPDYKISIDPSRNELRPSFGLLKLQMVYDQASSTNTRKTGDVISLDYTETVIPVQRFGSTNESLIAGNFYGYRGSILLSPQGDTVADYGVNPDVLNRIDLYPNFVNMRRAWNSEWGVWTNDPGAAEQSIIGSDVNSQLTKSINERTQQINASLNTPYPSDSSINVGEFVTNVALQPYMKSQLIYFRASGLKPLTRMYPFFGERDVSGGCMPLRPYTGAITFQNGVAVSVNNLPLARDFYGNAYEFNFGAIGWGQPLTTDASGNLYGIMSVPPNTFRAAEQEFKLQDTPFLTVTGSSSVASAIFYGTALSVQKRTVDLQIRPVVQVKQEITNITNVHQTYNTYNTFNTFNEYVTVNNINNVTNIINNQQTIVYTRPPPDPWWQDPNNFQGGGCSGCGGSF